MRKNKIRAAIAGMAVLLAGGTGLTAVAASPAHAATPCVTSSPTGSCGPYSDPNVFIGPNGADLVVQNDFSAIPQTLTSNADSNWTVAASTVGQGDQTSVKSYPATQVTYTLTNGHPEPSADFGTSLVSDYTDVIPSGSGQDYEYAVDDWLADPAQPSWTNDLEIMIWNNVNQQVPAGSPNGMTYVDPSGQSWQVWTAGGSTTVSPVSTVSFVRGSIANPANVSSGTFDRMGFYEFLQAHGLLSSTYGIDQLNYGLEICSTGGATRTYGVSNYTVVPNGQQQAQAPVVATNAASGISQTGATLNGSVNPESQATTYQFDYGTTTSYGTSVPAPAGSAGSGSAAVNESQAVTGLTASTTYHYRIEATNPTGTTLGSDQTFTTAGTPPPPQAPVVSTNAASGVSNTAATLNGTVNPEGQATTWQYQWGTTTSYGSVAPASPGSAGSGNSAVSEPSALTGLAASTTYHYRLTATNATGTTNGADQSFTTAATGGGGVVTFDASSSAHVTGNSTLQWTHTVGSGTDRALMTEVSVGISADGGCFIAMTDNGVTIPFKGLVHANNKSAGFVAIYGMVNPPSGANTLKAVTTSCAGGTPEATSAGAVSFSGVSQASPFGAQVHNAGSGTSTTATIGSAASDQVFTAMANGSPITGIKSPGTSRFIVNVDSNTAAGNSAAGTWAGTGSNVTPGWNVNNDWWGEIGLLVQHD